MNLPEYNYYFSVEGQTEKNYLHWLERLINQNLNDKVVKFNIKVTNSPLKRIKSLPIDQRVDVYHFCDIESLEPYHIKIFHKTIDDLVKAKSKPNIKDYYLCYSNFTFELWIILHKMNFYSSVSNRKNYIKQINYLFKTDFRGLHEFKRKENIIKILKQLKIEDVINAIWREKEIVRHNELNNYQKIKYKGYNYFRENPSSSVGSYIEKILLEVGLLNE